MIRFWMTICLSTALLSCSGERPVSELDIVGGRDASEKEAASFGSVLILKESGKYQCSGVLVGPKSVLTAAHCVTKNAVVSFGAKLSRKTTQLRRVIDSRVWQTEMVLLEQKILRKEELKKISRSYNDLALLTLNENAPKNYRPARITSEKFKMKEGHPVLITGFGITGTPIQGARLESAGDYRQLGKKVSRDHGELRILGTRFYSNSTKTGEILVGHKNGKAACVGDSGGPAFTYRESRGPSGKKIVQYFLVGIASRANCVNLSWYTDLRYHSVGLRRLLYTKKP